LLWQVRGGADLIAFVSNVLLFYLLYRFVRKIKIFDEFQVFLFPFLFLLMFSRPPEELAAFGGAGMRMIH
jgi:hypothetical protein